MQYPIYKKARKTYYNSDEFAGTIVKFTGFKTGTVVAVFHDDAPTKVNHYTDAWLAHTDTDAWEDISPSDDFFREISRRTFDGPPDISAIID